MYRQMSRTQREAAFLEQAVRMYSELEDWYDRHPEASFGEIEAEARRLRREMMGVGLAILISGRDVGFQLEAQCVKHVNKRWDSRVIGRGAYQDWKGRHG